MKSEREPPFSLAALTPKKLTEVLMNKEFHNRSSLVRFTSAVAALFISASTGWFIDFLATSYDTAAGGQLGAMVIAETKR